MVLGFFVSTSYLTVETQAAEFLETINRSLITILIFWTFHQVIGPLSVVIKSVGGLLSKDLINWIIKAIKVLIFILGAAAVLELWGIKIGPIIAGLGLFGVAVALGAQDLFKNLISGILVLVERRFQVGDWIYVEGVIEGTVESIGFRSTVVRRFDKSLATIPNFQFAENAVINNTQTTNRRINWMIGLEYRTTSEQLKNIKKEIEDYIKKSDDFVKSEDTLLSVKIDQFAASSIDIRLICFTKTRYFQEWLNVKDTLALEIKNIVEKNKASFAFPKYIGLCGEKFMKSVLILFDNVITLYIWILIINAVISWLVAFNILNTGNRFVYAVLDFSYRLTAPALNYIRRFLPNLGSIDISPVILILALMFLRNFVFEMFAPSLF